MSDEQTASSPAAVTFMGSDNQAGAHPKILDALASASSGLVSAYGEGSLTEGLNHRFSEIFEVDFGGEAWLRYCVLASAWDRCGVLVIVERS